MSVLDESGGVREAGRIGPGLLALAGFAPGDGPDVLAWMAAKIADLRVFAGEGPSGFDRSLRETGGGLLVVSQFTLYGDARKGRRPTWADAAPGSVSEPIYEAFCDELMRLGAHVERGTFGADMRVSSVNDGPVTLVLEAPPA